MENLSQRTLKINETFLSLQGESSHVGRVCSFVRLSGCPLRCTYCDTEYAFYGGEVKTFDEILATLKGYGSSLVEVTGGEPLAQKNCLAFLECLCEHGYEVLLETSGAYSTEKIASEVKVILDVKTPTSGEAHRQFWDNMGFLKSGRDEVKFVVGTREDFEYSLKIAHQYDLFSRVTVLVSPVHGKLSNEELSRWVLESKQPFRFQIQLHKYIWGAETRGV